MDASHDPEMSFTGDSMIDSVNRAQADAIRNYSLSPEDLDRANPKDANGRAKLPMHLWPASATAYGSVGLLEGMLKYGRTNWRATPVFAHIYLAAAVRHLSAWFEGEDFTDEGAPHLGNALACIAILVDAKTHGTLIDDRQFDPTAGTAHNEMIALLTDCANKLKARFGDVKPKDYDRRDLTTGKVQLPGGISLAGG